MVALSLLLSFSFFLSSVSVVQLSVVFLDLLHFLLVFHLFRAFILRLLREQVYYILLNVLVKLFGSGFQYPQ
jgi:hypothetical protein